MNDWLTHTRWVRDMRTAGIHIGYETPGNGPMLCTVDGANWPCSVERTARYDRFTTKDPQWELEKAMLQTETTPPERTVMTDHDKIVELRRILIDLEQLGSLVNIAGMNDVDDVLAIWDAADNLRQTASVLAREASTAAAAELGFSKQHESEIGIVHTASQSNTKTDGDAILSKLSTQMVEPESGELMAAIPTNVLREVLPAVGVGQVSSKWKKAGLKNQDLNPTDFMTTVYAERQVVRGPKPK
jgi:hypothetical protein